VRLSVIVPTWNESALIERTLAAAANADELVVVDGGSTDDTVARAERAGARVLLASRGRGRQLSTGAAAATGDVLMFLHADTLLPPGFRDEVCNLVAAGHAVWGRFDVRFDEGSPLVHLIARLISIRSRVSRVATGDQAIFVTREAFLAVGGLREDVLFEDIDLCRRLKRHGAMCVPAKPVVTSARRWRADGAWRTSFLMWGLKLLYLAGVPADRLAARYRDVR